MKIAITGKGGTGKTTIAGLLAHAFLHDGYQVLAVDADPDANLASALGIPAEQAAAIVPLSQQRNLIQERTGAKPGQLGQFFKLNPRVNDIPDKFCFMFKGIKMLVLGAVKKGGGGCACPENVLLRSLLSEIILNRDEIVIVDMEAGIEHLGRATSQAIDNMIIMVEPGTRSLSTAKTIMKLAGDIGLATFGIIGNKIQTEDQAEWIAKQFPEKLILGMIPYSDNIRESDIQEKPLMEMMDGDLQKEFRKIYLNLRGLA